ncbi:hypothetical protein ACFWN1_08795 [Streptomyces sp. NPDC058459]|uniref:hypothetical protein n=1 Tax=Streptomyces sp. NPDC058459 TaxID=3346508 RepID=UPI0036545020
MAGSDDAPVAAADEALYVLTAALLTPAQFPSVLGDDYPAACAALGLTPLDEGYGLVLGQDGEGARWTAVIDDVSLVAVAIASWDCGMEYELSPDGRTVVAALPGWPLALAVAAPDVPAPHDPVTDATDQPPLTPPDTRTWGAAQRRLAADEIALRWAEWRGRLDNAAVLPGERPSGTAAPALETAPDTQPEPEGTAKRGHPGVRQALAEAHAYIDTPPPLGRVRSSFAPGDARTLRADGPGWSIVARTDDIAFVLLDAEPGEVIPVGRGPELPGLLEGLDKIAVRPL